MSAGLDAVKARMEDIKEKRQRNEATNVENDLFTTLEIVNEMLKRWSLPLVSWIFIRVRQLNF